MRRLVAAGIAALLLGVAGCGSQPLRPDDFGKTVPVPGESTPSVESGDTADDPPPAPSYDFKGVEAMLTRRAAALQQGDGPAYELTSGGAQHSRDAGIAQSAHQLRPQNVHYEIDNGIDFSDEDHAVAHATLHFEIPNVPGAYSEPRTLKVSNSTGEWRVSSDKPAVREGLPWEVLAPMQVAREVHFVILHPSDVALGDLPSELENGYEAIDKLFADRLPGRILVVVGAGPSQIHKLTSGILGINSLSAVADSDVQQHGRAKSVSKLISQRLLVVWSNFAAMDLARRQTLVTHELTHIALAGRTTGRTPSWLIEGAALLVSDDRRAAMAGMPTLEDLSAPDAIAKRTGDNQGMAYAAASVAAFKIADKFGAQKFFDLYDAFNDSSLKGDTPADLADAACHRVLGVSLASLDP